MIAASSAFGITATQLVGQVVEHRCERVVKQRQVILDSGRRHALTHVLIDRTTAHVDVEQLVPTIAKARDRIRRQREFFRRQDFDGAICSMVRWCRDRRCAGSRPRRRTGRFDTGTANPSERRRPASRGSRTRRAPRRSRRSDSPPVRVAAVTVRVEAGADRQHQTVRREKRRRRQPLQQRADRHDEHAASECRQPMQRAQAVRHDVLVGGERVVGQRLPIGQRHDVEMPLEKNSSSRHNR